MKKRRLRVFSRHPSHDVLRQQNLALPVLTCIRLGSETKGDLPYEVEINSVESIKNSSNKLLMKRCFDEAKIPTATWIHSKDKNIIEDFGQEHLPLVAKKLYGSRGKGNTLINGMKELSTFLEGKNLSEYIFEKFHNYNREYRLHVTSDGCFYTCRKMLKSGTPKEDTWFRNDSNCVWIMENNPEFDKPSCWKEMEAACVAALKTTGLDVAGFDVKVQSEMVEGKQRKSVGFIVIESNSACSHGDETVKHYCAAIPKIVANKMKTKQ